MIVMGVMNRQIPVETTAGELTSHALMENASLPLGNVIDGRIAIMEVMKTQLSVADDVYKTPNPKQCKRLTWMWTILRMS